MGHFAKTMLQRLAASVGVLLAVFTISFFIMRLAPGGPFERLEGLRPEMRRNLEARYGLGQGLGQQYAQALGAALRGDLGISLAFAPGEPVGELLGRYLPVSAALGGISLLLALAIGIPAGAVTGRRRHSVGDQAVTLASLAVVSASVIVIAALLRALFLTRPGLFTLGGFDSLRNGTLPVATLALAYAAICQRLVRAAVAAQVESGMLAAATARGVPDGRVFRRYLLPQALIPMLSSLGPLVAGLLTGSFVVESIFEVPGIAACFVAGAQARDYPLVMGGIMLYTALLVALNFLFESLHALLDPRQRQGRSATS